MKCNFSLLVWHTATSPHSLADQLPFLGDTIPRKTPSDIQDVTYKDYILHVGQEGKSGYCPCRAKFGLGIDDAWPHEAGEWAAH